MTATSVMLKFMKYYQRLLSHKINATDFTNEEKFLILIWRNDIRCIKSPPYYAFPNELNGPAKGVFGCQLQSSLDKVHLSNKKLPERELILVNSSMMLMLVGESSELWILYMWELFFWVNLATRKDQ